MTGPARTVAIVVHALLLIIALGPAIAWGDIESDLDQLLAACAEKGLFSGSVLVAEQGRPVYLRSFGSAGIGSEEAIGPDHAFRLASVGKAFTAMSIMILAEEGCLTFEDEVKTHLPEFPYDDITIRHLLNHTSGLPDYVVLLDEHWDREHAGSPDRKVATSGDA
ncbi:MAG: beta-lactamase family protein, partial [bacterium]|nr:beta-lactamase family protein [bacterium]